MDLSSLVNDGTAAIRVLFDTNLNGIRFHILRLTSDGPPWEPEENRSAASQG